MTDGRSIAYACSYVPLEIIMASGFIPRRIVPAAQPVEAESHIHANTCCYVKSLLAGALQAGLPGRQGIVFANSCDGMRRLFDLWGRYVPQAPALFFDIPKQKDPEAIRFFASELKRLADGMEATFGGQAVTEERLNKAIRECNQVRAMMAEVLNVEAYTGSDLFTLCLNGSQSPLDEFSDAIRTFQKRSGNTVQSEGNKRILVTGNCLNRLDLIALIEDAGGQVVALDTCIGERAYNTLVDEDTDNGFEALARRYLMRTPCSRMMGVEEQCQHLKASCARHHAHGIICSSVKFCDPLLYSIPFLQQRFRGLNIPFLGLENDYTWSDPAQIKTRVETFIAMLAEDHHV